MTVEAGPPRSWSGGYQDVREKKGKSKITINKIEIQDEEKKLSLITRMITSNSEIGVLKKKEIDGI